MATTPISVNQAAKPASSGINKDALKSLGGVLFAGAVGGLLYWIVAKFTGTPLPTVFGAGTAFVLMFIGALAGTFGVYLLTASDVSAIRTYIFACVCGLAWKPIIDSAQTIATNRIATSQTQQMQDSLQQIDTATSSGSVKQIIQAVENAVPAVNQALHLSTGITDPTKKAEIVDTSKHAIAELQSSAAKAPGASVDALTKISSTAANSGEPALALRGIESLHTIGSNAFQTHNKIVVEKVTQSLSSLAAQSSDASIRTAAQAASQFQ